MHARDFLEMHVKDELELALNEILPVEFTLNSKRVRLDWDESPPNDPRVNVIDQDGNRFVLETSVTLVPKETT